MTVAELIEALQKCDPNRRVVGFEQSRLVEYTTVVQEDVGGLGSRMSFEYVHVVRLCEAAPGHLEKQGYDVKADIPRHFDRAFDYSKMPE